MLKSIRVKNFALAEDVELSLHEGLTVFSGETGAGKSLLLNAILLLLGNRASASWVRKGATKAEVEGTFFIGRDPGRVQKIRSLGFEIEDPNEDLLVIRREFTGGDSAVSRIWVQGKASTRAQLQDIMGDLIEVSGQHEFLKLNRSAYILEVLDHVSKNPHIDDYKKRYADLQVAEAEQEKFSRLYYSDEEVSFLENECEALRSFSESENLPQLEEALDRRVRTINSREKIVEELKLCLDLTSESSLSESGEAPSLAGLGNRLDRELRKLSLLGTFEKVEAVFATFREHVGALEKELQSAFDMWSSSDEPIEELQAKLSQLRRLKRKYNILDVTEFPVLYRKKLTELEDLKNLQEKKSTLHALIEGLEKDLRTLSAQISGIRENAGKKLSAQWENSIHELGMPHAVLKIALAKSDTIGPLGGDDVTIYFSSNKGHEMLPLSKVASGGELSRILLSLKESVAQNSMVGVYLFDEVDAGIGGETAYRVGVKLAHLAAQSQVLVVTHLPQIACYARDHVLVEKSHTNSTTRSTLKKLKAGEKLDEIARMLGGKELASARKLASELLKRAQSDASV